MGYRFVVWLSLALGCWGQEALRDLMEWGPAEVARMEATLRKDPRNFQARLQLMAYARRGDQEGKPGSLEKRIEHALWLAENAPESEILGSHYAQFLRGQLRDAELRRFVEAFRRAKGDRKVIAGNASHFFASLDEAEHWKYLAERVRFSPGDAMAIRTLADLCAVSIGEGGEKRARAMRVLAESSNAWLLSNTAHQMFLRGVDGADGYFLRAKMIEPSIRQEVVFPAPKVVAPLRVVRNGEVKRVALREFRGLPQGLAEVLTQRDCMIPQPGGEKLLRNVIRGEFIAKGEKGWAVLCSVRGKSSILVFRSDGDREPAVLATREDMHYMQDLGGEAMEYSRMIRAVGKEYIVKHYRAYGGPKPPAIDHEGIDDAFLGKASGVWYWHAGKWMRLQGAD